MSGALENRVCIVTGAARGIGASFALRMSQAGARIVAADRASCAETLRTVRSAGGTIEEVTADVATAAGARTIVDAALAAFGRIDALVNNAALYGGIRLRPFEDIPEDEWDAVMTVNVKGVWQMCRAVAPHMRARGYGRIVNISSNVVFMGKGQFLHYVASKGAVWAMTGALSREVAGSGITVNAIAPGYTITDATRSMADAAQVALLESNILSSQSVKRLIEPQDLAGAAIFLASEASGMVTGQTLTVDGGTITR
ncbi:MAG: SDR family oxidoreductase [Betaproteobacteria bacterium]|nr:SDR family oxidoreductase [Betaproteobacteria bacterium]